MNLQDFVDSINYATKQERTRYHLTLGELLDVLDEFGGHKTVEFSDGASPNLARSYRGYYSDLALSSIDGVVTISDLRERLEEVHDSELKGYKGGDFRMTDDTPLWQAEWGKPGRPILGTKWKNNTLILVLK